MPEAPSDISTHPPAIDVDTRVPTDADLADCTCVKCSYSLAGLTLSGKCPECGSPASESLNERMLRYADSEYLNKVLLGTRAIKLALIIQVLITIAFVFYLLASLTSAFEYFTTTTPLTRAILPGSQIANMCLFCCGIFWLTTTDTRSIKRHRQGDTAKDPLAGHRLRLRYATIAYVGYYSLYYAVAYIIETISPSTSGYELEYGIGLLPHPILTYLIPFGLTSVVLITTMMFIAQMAQRIPDATLARRARRNTWLTPIIYIVLYIIAWIGAMIAMLMYYNTFNALGKHVARARKSA